MIDARPDASADNKHKTIHILKKLLSNKILFYYTINIRFFNSILKICTKTK